MSVLVFKDENTSMFIVDSSKHTCAKIDASELTPGLMYKKFISKNKPVIIKNFVTAKAQHDSEQYKYLQMQERWRELSANFAVPDECMLSICYGNKSHLGYKDLEFPCYKNTWNSFQQYFRDKPNPEFAQIPYVEEISNGLDFKKAKETDT